MVRELHAGKCAVQVSAHKARTKARDNIWRKRSMATGQCLDFIVLDLVFIVRELQVRIPAHRSHSSSPSLPTQLTNTSAPKETGSSDSTTESVRKACVLDLILAPCNATTLF